MKLINNMMASQQAGKGPNQRPPVRQLGFSCGWGAMGIQTNKIEPASPSPLTKPSKGKARQNADNTPSLSGRTHA